MRRFLRAGLATLFVLLLLLGTVSVQAIVRVQSDGRLINYVGIVRGATQRLVKLELQDRPNDGLLEYLDGILAELNGGEGPYALSSPDDRAYQENLRMLTEMWGELKGEIRAHREEPEAHGALLELSETYFEQANDTVFAAENYSARQTRALLTTCVVMLGVMLLTWIIIFLAGARQFLHLEDANRQLSDLTQRDTLTGVYTLAAFKAKARALLDRAPGERYAVVYTDFADFKYLNNMFGYDYGDKVLARYGEILREGKREDEICGRVSADHFVLLLRFRERREVAERQRRADEAIIAFMHQSSGKHALPTCCGICFVEDAASGAGVDELLDRANFARKTVKNGTNPNYQVYDDSIRDRLREEKEVESRMLGALENREFMVYYQPKVDLSDGRIGCSEALVRWQARDGCIIPPDRFIPVFEKKFMIGLLDQYVFEEVCRWLRQRLDGGKTVLPVSVNVSRIQFYDQDFIRRYTAIRDRYQIPHSLLEIEFTESVAFGNTELLLKIVEELRQAGFTCSIDDFGKEYSSLSLLKSLPVDSLKLDRFFFLDEEDERSRAVVQGIVELVHKFGIKAVAEGVESAPLVEFLKEVGCDYVQGYVFYRPMRQGDFERLLDERAGSPEGPPPRASGSFSAAPREVGAGRN